MNDRSTCLAAVPQQEVSLVDWKFELTKLYYHKWRDVEKKVIVMMLENPSFPRSDPRFDGG